MQTADCRPGAKCRLVQNADLGTKMQTEYKITKYVMKIFYLPSACHAIISIIAEYLLLISYHVMS